LLIFCSQQNISNTTPLINLNKASMIDRVSVPTDNIYKFIAIFSLVTLLFCGWQSFATNANTNAILIQIYPEIEALKSIESRSPSQEAKLALLERQVEVAIKDRTHLAYVLGVFIAASIFGMWYGFYIWKTQIQTISDSQNKAQLDILNLQIEKLKLENQKLAESLKNSNPGESK
jgi:hypothetical protein